MRPVVFLWIVSDGFQVRAHLMVGNEFGWFDGVERKLRVTSNSTDIFRLFVVRDCTPIFRVVRGVPLQGPPQQDQ